MSEEWTEALWMAPLEVPEETESQILEALGCQADPAHLHRIQEALAYYRADIRNERLRPRLAGDAATIRTIAQLSGELESALRSLRGSAEDRLESRYYCEAYDLADPRTAKVLFQELPAILGRLKVAAELPTKGRPKKEPLTLLVYQLACIWRDVHSEPPRRSYHEFKRKEAGPFRRFVAACLEALPAATRPEKPPDGIIRAVCALMEKTRKRPLARPGAPRSDGI